MQLRRIYKLILNLTLSAVTLLGIAIFQPADAAPAYTITEIPLGNATLSGARDINNKGEVLGYMTPEGEKVSHAFLYSNGTVKDLGALNLNWLNDLGQLAGQSETDLKKFEHAILYDNGQIKDLGTLGGARSSATNLNNKGEVVGVSYIQGDAVRHAFLYSNGVMRDLGKLGGNFAMSADINESSQVVGFSQTPTGTSRAFLYEKGVMRDIGTLGGTSSRASAINNRGQIVGEAAIKGNKVQHVFLYEKGRMRDLGTLIKGADTFPTSVNNKGQVVGYGRSAGTGGGDHAFLYSDGKIKDLNNLIPPNSDYEIFGAFGINDAGQIAASATLKSTRESRVLLLTPMAATSGKKS